MSDENKTTKIITWFDLGYKSLTVIVLSTIAIIGAYISLLQRLNTIESDIGKDRQRLEYAEKYIYGIDKDLKHNAEEAKVWYTTLSDKLTDLRILFAGQNSPRR